MKRGMAALLMLCLLTGCGSLLERSYSTSEPHSSKYWESGAARNAAGGKRSGHRQ